MTGIAVPSSRKKNSCSKVGREALKKKHPKEVEHHVPLVGCPEMGEA